MHYLKFRALDIKYIIAILLSNDDSLFFVLCSLFFVRGETHLVVPGIQEHPQASRLSQYWNRRPFEQAPFFC